MSILIKDMEVPTDNTVLIRVFPASENGECYVQQLDVDGDILTELWAVPVPPHGKLIESKAFLKVAYETDDFSLDELAHLAVLVAATPTIIPADDPKEE